VRERERRYLWLHPIATLAAIAALCSAHALAALLIAVPQPGAQFDRAWCVLAFGVGAAALIVRAPHWAAVLGLCASGYANGMLRGAGYVLELPIVGVRWSGALPIESLLPAVLWLIAAQVPGRLQSWSARVAVAVGAVASLSIAAGTILGTFDGVPWGFVVPLSAGALVCLVIRSRWRLSPSAKLAIVFLAIPALYLAAFLATGVAIGGKGGAAATNLVFSMLVPILVGLIPSPRREGNGSREGNGPARAAVVG
jgi:hypothetical protein